MYVPNWKSRKTSRYEVLCEKSPQDWRKKNLAKIYYILYKNYTVRNFHTEFFDPLLLSDAVIRLRVDFVKRYKLTTYIFIFS